jgi:hypothetical protein
MVSSVCTNNKELEHNKTEQVKFPWKRKGNSKAKLKRILGRAIDRWRRK